MSAFLFSMFVNDLEQELISKDIAGLVVFTYECRLYCSLFGDR